MTTDANERTSWLIGIRLDAENELATYYTVVTGVDEKPVLVNDQLLFISKLEQLEEAQRLSRLDRSILNDLPHEPDLICDVAGSLYLIENAANDEGAQVLNCVNTLFDFVKATNGIIPECYRKELHAFADHLTFERSLAQFLDVAPGRRSDIVNGILWCVGWMMTHARILGVE